MACGCDDPKSKPGGCDGPKSKPCGPKSGPCTCDDRAPSRPPADTTRRTIGRGPKPPCRCEGSGSKPCDCEGSGPRGPTRRDDHMVSSVERAMRSREQRKAEQPRPKQIRRKDPDESPRGRVPRLGEERRDERPPARRVEAPPRLSPSPPSPPRPSTLERVRPPSTGRGVPRTPTRQAQDGPPPRSLPPRLPGKGGPPPRTLLPREPHKGGPAPRTLPPRVRSEVPGPKGGPRDRASEQVRPKQVGGREVAPLSPKRLWGAPLSGTQQAKGPPPPPSDHLGILADEAPPLVAVRDILARAACGRYVPNDINDPAGFNDPLDEPSFAAWDDEPLIAHVPPVEPIPVGPNVRVVPWLLIKAGLSRPEPEIWVAELRTDQFPGPTYRDTLVNALAELKRALADPDVTAAILHVVGVPPDPDHELDSQESAYDWWTPVKANIDCAYVRTSGNDRCGIPPDLLRLEGAKNFVIEGIPAGFGPVVLRVSGDASPTGGALFTVADCENFVIRNLIFDGNRRERGAVSQGLKPEDLDGIDFPYGPPLTLLRTKLRRAHGGGDLIRLSHCRRGQLENVTAVDAPATGISITTKVVNGVALPPSSDIRLVDCKAIGNSHKGISVEAAHRLRVIGGDYSYTTGFWTMGGIDLEARTPDYPWPEVAICDVVIEGARFEANWKDIQINARHRVSNIVVRNCTFVGYAERNLQFVTPAWTPWACDPADPRCALEEDVHRAGGILSNGAWVWILGNEFREYTNETRALVGVIDIGDRARGRTVIRGNTFVGVEALRTWEIYGAMRGLRPIVVDNCGYANGQPVPITACPGSVEVIENTWRIRTPHWGDSLVGVAPRKVVTVSDNHLIFETTGAMSYPSRILRVTEVGPWP